ncbi:MAG TPA: HlyD family efflux transporter periplasmic adaptor subunit [Candidatus Hydrogenedentes bacterium]|nr:HlyD family efflux transporter periplasmic adaptor subunit [Candidatus Hydrogenedentota bacterium]HIJ73097.1 HlyD family efflux transporter periplasmic adaptor subunit [Candidatus Hydrogenedentota bacterium]
MMADSEDNAAAPAIRTPLPRQLRLWRQRLLPIVVWLIGVALVITLMGRQRQRIDAVGIAEVRQATVAPVFDGTVHAISVDVFDPVQAGEAVAVMDDTLIQAELITLKAELAHLSGELEARREQLKLDGMAAQHRVMLDADDAQIDYLLLVAEYESDKAALKRLEGMCASQNTASDSALLDRRTSDETLLRYESLARRVAEYEEAMAAARVRMEQAEQRRDLGKEAYGDHNWASLLEPFQREIRVQEARLSEIAQRTQFLVLRAPLAGRVSSIVCRSGETVLAGMPVLTIASPDSQRVLAYIPEHSLRAVEVGAVAEVYSRRKAGPAVRGSVLRVDGKVEAMPMALWRNQAVSERGLSILVGGIPPGRFFPGEALDVRFPPASESL